MSNSDVTQFMEVTECDRRTALFCLLSHNNNLTLALSYYFDNSNRIVVPPEFMNEGASPETQSQDLLPVQTPVEGGNLRRQRSRPTISSRHASSPPSSATTSPPVAQSPITSTPPAVSGVPSARSTRNMNKYQKEKPELFFPYGFFPMEKLIRHDLASNHSLEKKCEAPQDVFCTLTGNTIRCIVWRDGLTWDSKFFTIDNPDCAKAIAQIEKNKLPTAILQGEKIDVADVDITFKRDQNHDSN